MRSYLFLLPLVGIALGSLEERDCHANNCYRQVAGTRLGPAHIALQSADCTSFFEANTATFAIPTYASDCHGSSDYSSACSCFGIIGATATSSTTITATSALSSSSLTTPFLPSSTCFPSSSSPSLSSSISLLLSSSSTSSNSSARPNSRSHSRSRSHLTHSHSLSTSISRSRIHISSSSSFSSNSTTSIASSFSTSSPYSTIPFSNTSSSSIPTASTISIPNTSSIYSKVTSVTTPSSSSKSLSSSSSETAAPSSTIITSTIPHLNTSSSSSSSSTPAPSCTADTQNDPQNCGVCGNVCVSGLCDSGSCTDDTCVPLSCGFIEHCNEVVSSSCYCFTSISGGASNGFCGANAICDELTACGTDDDCAVDGSSGNICAVSTCCPEPSIAQPGVCLQGSCGNPASKLMMMARAIGSSGTAAY